MFRETRIPPLTEGQLRGMQKKRYNQLRYADTALFLLLNDPQFPKLDQLTAESPYWKRLQELGGRKTRAWLKLNDGIELGTLERFLFEIESNKPNK